MDYRLLDCHAATAAEQLEIYRNVHDVWGCDLSLEQHVARRLASPQHNQAQWYCGTFDEHVVTSLGCYPMQFWNAGRVVPGIALGSVHTLAKHRGQGLAPSLIRFVEEVARQGGAEWSLLYSDIDPNYYARLGYQLCPAWRGLCRLAEAPSDLGPDPELEVLSNAEARIVLPRLYDLGHSASALSVARSADYWEYLKAKSPGDIIGWLRNHPSETAVGYVRLTQTAQTIRLRDWAVLPPRDENLPRLIAGLLRMTRNAGAEVVIGWVPQHPAFMQRFQIERRTNEITMVKCLTPGRQATAAELRAAEDFQEIDHV